MIPQSLLIIWVLFHSFHAFPVKETLEKEVPITNNDVKLTEEVSSLLSDVTAEGKLGEVGLKEQAKADPAKFASQSNDENILKKLEECKKVATKSEDFSWSIRKECLKMFLAEANKQQNELKKLKSAKVVRKDLVTFSIDKQIELLHLIRSLYLRARNAVIGFFTGRSGFHFRGRFGKP